jgi:hypothetical protein
MKKCLEMLNDPHFLMKFHGWATLIWIVLVIPTVLLWPESILWLALMSVWANVAGHWAAYQAAHADKNLDQKI